MSSILKALKKLENDTAKFKPDLLRIDAKILQDESSARFSRTAVSLIAVALFVCGSGAMYLYMKHDTPDVVVSQALSSHSATNIQPTVSMMGTPPVLNKDQLKPSTQTLPSPKARPAPVVVRSNTVAAKSSRPSQLKNKIEKTSTPASGPVSIATAPTTTVIRPALTVNGIAFQDGGRNNMAMINEITVSSGDMIEGVKVEEIQKNRVIFSQGGEKFEIRLNKSNR